MSRASVSADLTESIKHRFRSLSRTTLPAFAARGPRAKASVEVAATLLVVLGRRTRCRVTLDDGWVHRYANGVVTRETIGGPTVTDMIQHTRSLTLPLVTIDPGDVVIDVGGGIGEECYLLSELVSPGGTVLTVEAHPDTCRLLRKNITDNGLTNVEVIHAAAASINGELTIDAGTTEESLTRRIGGGGEVGKITVPARTIAAVIRERGIGKVKLLKMNIEGAEVAALVGLGSEAERVENVAISCHDFLADRTGDASLRTKQRVRALLLESGFLLQEFPNAATPWGRDYVYGTRDAR